MSKKDKKIQVLEEQVAELRERLSGKNKTVNTVLRELSGLQNFIPEKPGYRLEDYKTVEEYRAAYDDAHNRFEVLQYRCTPDSALELPEELEQIGMRAFYSAFEFSGAIVDKDYNMLFSWSDGDGYPNYQFPCLNNNLYQYGSHATGMESLSIKAAVDIFMKEYKKDPSRFELSINQSEPSLDSEAKDMSAAKDAQDTPAAGHDKDKGAI